MSPAVWPDSSAGDAGGDEQHDAYANGVQEHHEDADMADAHDHEQHMEQEQQQQYHADMPDNEQQHLQATDSAGLQQLEENDQHNQHEQQEQPNNATAAAEAAARRISAAASEAAEDNLLSGLADDNDDDIILPKPAAGTPSGTPTAAAAASGEDGGAGGDANKPVTEYELNILNLRAANKPLNARQRRTLNRLLTRQQGQEAAAKLGLDVNSLLEAQGEEQQQQGGQQGQQQQGQSKVGDRVRSECSGWVVQVYECLSDMGQCAGLYLNTCWCVRPSLSINPCIICRSLQKFVQHCQLPGRCW